MAYFPRVGPFYDPTNEHEFYGEDDGRLRLRRSAANRDSGTGDSIGEQRSNLSDIEKLKTGWNSFVEGQGNLFYVSSDGHRHNDSDYGSGDRERHRKLADHVTHHDRQSSHGSGSSGCSASPREGVRQKTRAQDAHTDFSSHNGIPAGANIADSSNYITRTGSASFPHSVPDSPVGLLTEPTKSAFSKYSDRYSLHDQTQPKLSLPLQSDSFTADSHSHSGKRKSFYLVPNFRNIESVNDFNGVELCEKLFGIILCQYKHRPPRPGAQTEQVLRERKVIVQGVVIGSQAEICGKIFRGDMLVGMNDADVTWVNIDDIFRLVPKHKVKLTFQVPLVIGPKSTPPATPTTPGTPPVPRLLPASSTPPIPQHLPPTRPPVPPRRPTEQNLVTLTTGESPDGVAAALQRYLVTVMYLTLSGQSDNAKDDVLYQYPQDDNKLTDIRGLYQTLSGLLVNVTGGPAKLTCVRYRGNTVHASYWQEGQDILIVCFPDSRVPPQYLQHILSDLLILIKVLFGSVADVFRDHEFHSRLDQLISLTLHRVLLRGVDTQSIPSCSPLEPALIDTLTGIRCVRLSQDNSVLCDEILSEYEAQDFTEFEGDTDARRNYGILGSCLYFKNYLLCSHLNPSDLRDVHLFLQYHCILGLVNRRSVNELVIWREFYPTRLCHTERQIVPGYNEPRAASWFILVVVMKHYVLCTLLEAGSYASPAFGHPRADTFLVEHARATVAQIQTDDANIEHCCNQRLQNEQSGPTLANVETDRPVGGRLEDSYISPGKHPPAPPLHKQTSSPGKLEASPRHRDDSDNVSLHSVTSPDQLHLNRQDSRKSYGSNDSNSSTNSAGAKVRSAGRVGSMIEMSSLNRSFSERDIRQKCNMKLPRGVDNCLFHYVSFDHLEGIYISPTPCDIAGVDGALHQHLLYNFHACCLKIHAKFERYTNPETLSPTTDLWRGVLEEGVMFTCEIRGVPDPRKPTPVLMYWVIGRLLPEDREMYVCLQDGTSQLMLELAFRHNFGLR